MAAAGLDVSFVRSAAALVELVAGGASTVVVDLGRPDALGAIRAVRDSASVSVVAFGAHVDSDRLQHARDAGAATVLAQARSSPIRPDG